MRRPWLIATFVLSAALSLSWAQRAGMRGGASGARGFAPRSGMQGRSAQFARAPRTSVRFGTTFRPPERGRDGFRHRRFSTRFPRQYAGYGYAGYYGGYYSPFYWDWYGSSHDSADNEYGQQQTARQIDDLSQEVQRLREERDYSQAPAAPVPQPQPRTEAKLDSGLPIVLVFLDRRIQEIKNYAVMNETLVVFDGARTKRIPLADVDLAATMKLNDERGVDFQIPN